MPTRKPHLFKTSTTWKQPKSSLLERMWLSRTPITHSSARTSAALHARREGSLCVLCGGRCVAVLWSFALCTPSGQRAEQLKQSPAPVISAAVLRLPAHGTDARKERRLDQTDFTHTWSKINKGGSMKKAIFKPLKIREILALAWTQSKTVKLHIKINFVGYFAELFLSSAAPAARKY